jgi:hypothetical protein
MKLPVIAILAAAVTSAAGVAPAPCAECLTVTAVGDIMTGTTWPEPFLPPGDGEGMLDAVREALSSGDIVFGNLEGPMLEGGTPAKCGKKRWGRGLCYEFRMEPRYAARLADAGFNALNVANNHAWDFGEEGIGSTVSVLDNAGIQPVGGEEIATFEIGEKTVAVAGFSYSPPSPFSYSILDLEAAREVIVDLKGAYDIVIVSFHGGAEGKDALHVSDADEKFAKENRGNVLAFARAAVDAGADLVLGHGPHVPRALEIRNRKLIAYSLGNFLTYGQFNIKGPSGKSFILRARLDLDTGDFVCGELLPVELVGRGLPVPDPTGAAVKLVKALTEEDLGEAGAVIDDEGRISAR